MCLGICIFHCSEIWPEMQNRRMKSELTVSSTEYSIEYIILLIYIKPKGVNLTRTEAQSALI